MNQLVSHGYSPRHKAVDRSSVEHAASHTRVMNHKKGQALGIRQARLYVIPLSRESERACDGRGLDGRPGDFAGPRRGRNRN